MLPTNSLCFQGATALSKFDPRRSKSGPLPRAQRQGGTHPPGTTWGLHAVSPQGPLDGGRRAHLWGEGDTLCPCRKLHAPAQGGERLSGRKDAQAMCMQVAVSDWSPRPSGLRAETPGHWRDSKDSSTFTGPYNCLHSSF